MGQGVAPQITGEHDATGATDVEHVDVLEAKSFPIKEVFLPSPVVSVAGAIILCSELNLDVGVECPEVPEEPELP